MLLTPDGESAKERAFSLFWTRFRAAAIACAEPASSGPTAAKIAQMRNRQAKQHDPQNNIPAHVMTTDDLLAYFDGQTGVALALGIKQPSVAKWGPYPPLLRQLQAEALTHGELKAEPDCDRYRVGFGIIGTPKRVKRSA